ncbi:P-loop containing nucleoside triphosphate hydrolase protein [Athelia psychrophila]|uniref:P-loop containing nucleoside triphosphate hydrolase protein n=1 Tax=Athelia psychrophila TaxID=1759441 RepID=A0A166VV94_9AGAM|nr:P-loop containing nucleoside triphosphate hydrolase protein [Fibularhizoctonia sp. CBS 109695]
MSLQLGLRRRSMVWTDRRAKLLVEVFSTMRVVKYFSYEVSFLERLNFVRDKELVGIRHIQHAFSANLAFSLSIPVLSATLTFVTYTSIQPGFDSAVIFSSMGLFQLLRSPLMNLPRALSSIPDALNALARLQRVFHAPLMAGNAIDIDVEQAPALVVKDAVFQWESVPPVPNEDTKKDKGRANVKAAQPAPETETETEKQEERVPFKVEVAQMTVPRGSLVAIVGPVGSGKSSLLQGLIGEMRRDAGHISFGGRVSYCPQTAWIQNATLRNNITFGRSFDEDRYWQAVDNASLLPDLDALPDGDATEIGEKGINLSGGQKQRVSIARALYSNADVVIMDDPLSAVDAHVGKALFQNAILGAFRSKGASVILVTHALHFLSQCDYIYTVKDGRIVENGTHKELVAKAGEFARLNKAYGAGGVEQVQDIAEDAAEVTAPRLAMSVQAIKQKLEKVYHKSGTGKIEGRLIASEKRETGSVKWSVYGAYIRAGKGWITMPVIITFMILMQSSQILNSYALVWWEDDTFHRPYSFYQIIYACLGVSQAIFTLLMGNAMDYMANFASNALHRRAVQKIFYSPMSFFDTTPTGRILSVLQKDIDTIDNQLAMAVRIFVITMASVTGSIILIAILEVYFLIIVAAVMVLYGYFAMFYQASARELKRIDSLLCSIHYSHFSESLTGLPTIRSYGAIDRFINDNRYYLDLENRALFLTVTNQRWLAVRLDFLGSLLVLVVSIFSVVGISGINPAQIGVVLINASTLSQWGSSVTRQTAQVGKYNNMNSVERVVEYSRDGGLKQEKPHEIEDTKLPSVWPEHGAIEFKNIILSYRPGLPIVLKGVSVDIKGGEKIGVVGRTGAGKSSLMLALFRIVELTSGSITIDGVDISTIGLKDLRTKISIIPQDPLLFAGTIRSNLDPFSVFSDTQLWDALHKSYLTKASSSPKGDEDDDQHSAPRYNLDTIIEDDGTNLSVGGRSLLSLARALVKDSKVIVMDEATASVDLDTDNKIQKTIQKLQGRTLLTIAHRLRTIIPYDRILVLDAGTVAEFDTPRNLFGRDSGIFRSMCEQSGISLEDILASTE